MKIHLDKAVGQAGKHGDLPLFVFISSLFHPKKGLEKRRSAAFQALMYAVGGLFPAGGFHSQAIIQNPLANAGGFEE